LGEEDEDEEDEEPAEQPERDIGYYPKELTIIGISASYNGLTLGISQDIDTLGEEADDEEIESDYIDYNISYFFDNFGVEANYSDFKEFYVEGESGLSGEYSDSERLRKDLYITNAGVNVYGTLLWWNLSLKEALDGASQRKRTGMGLVGIFSYDHGEIGSDEEDVPFIPNAFAGDFGADGTITDGTFTATTYQIAYVQTLKVWKLYVTAIYAYGFGTNTLDYHRLGEDDYRSGTRESEKSITKLHAGYSGDRVFFGGSYKEDSPSYSLDSITLITVKSALEIFLGTRF
jgi:hypothetical protein